MSLLASWLLLWQGSPALDPTPPLAAEPARADLALLRRALARASAAATRASSRPRRWRSCARRARLHRVRP